MYLTVNKIANGECMYNVIYHAVVIGTCHSGPHKCRPVQVSAASAGYPFIGHSAVIPILVTAYIYGHHTNNPIHYTHIQSMLSWMLLWVTNTILI